MKKCLLSLLALVLSLSSISATETTSQSNATDPVYLREKIAELEAKISANDQRYEQRFADSEKAVNAALQAADKAVGAALQAAKEAVNKAETANEKHFDSVNEFRKTLGDQAAGFVTKDSLWTGLLGAISAIGVMVTIYSALHRRATRPRRN